jgi:hypothetical protein
VLKLVSLKALWAALEICAPGYTKRMTDHYWQVGVGSSVYSSLPLGPHGKRENPDIQVGHVKRMARILGVEACLARELSLG